MNTKFDVGEKVALVCAVSCINIDKDNGIVYYLRYTDKEGVNRCICVKEEKVQKLNNE